MALNRHLAINPGTEDLAHRLAETLKEARVNMELARLEHCNQYTKGRPPLEFAAEDKGLRRADPLSDAEKGFAASLSPRWISPYVVTKLVSRISYLLRNPLGG